MDEINKAVLSESDNFLIDAAMLSDSDKEEEGCLVIENLNAVLSDCEDKVSEKKMIPKNETGKKSDTDEDLSLQLEAALLEMI
jgi:hypothetical protein